MKDLFERGISIKERKKRKKIFIRGLLRNYMKSPIYRKKSKNIRCGCK
jgi:hypothetical protein